MRARQTRTRDGLARAVPRSPVRGRTRAAYAKCPATSSTTPRTRPGGARSCASQRARDSESDANAGKGFGQPGHGAGRSGLPGDESIGARSLRAREDGEGQSAERQRAAADSTDRLPTGNGPRRPASADACAHTSLSAHRLCCWTCMRQTRRLQLFLSLPLLPRTNQVKP
jgi:hypothetical protein